MASPAPRQHQPARPEGRLTKGSAEPAPPGEGFGLDTVLPWRQALLPPAGPPPEQVAPPIVPVAWLGRTSTEDSQAPTISLPRQLRNSRDALPHGRECPSGRACASPVRGPGETAVSHRERIWSGPGCSRRHATRSAASNFPRWRLFAVLNSNFGLVVLVRSSWRQRREGRKWLA